MRPGHKPIPGHFLGTAAYGSGITVFKFFLPWQHQCLGRGLMPLGLVEDAALGDFPGFVVVKIKGAGQAPVTQVPAGREAPGEQNGGNEAYDPEHGLVLALGRIWGRERSAVDTRLRNKARRRTSQPGPVPMRRTRQELFPLAR